MLQKGPDPSNTKAKIFPSNLYWPVSRNSGYVNRDFIVIVTGSILLNRNNIDLMIHLILKD